MKQCWGNQVTMTWHFDLTFGATMGGDRKSHDLCTYAFRTFDRLLKILNFRFPLQPIHQAPFSRSWLSMLTKQKEMIF